MVGEECAEGQVSDEFAVGLSSTFRLPTNRRLPILLLDIKEVETVKPRAWVLESRKKARNHIPYSGSGPRIVIMCIPCGIAEARLGFLRIFSCCVPTSLELLFVE